MARSTDIRRTDQMTGHHDPRAELITALRESGSVFAADELAALAQAAGDDESRLRALVDRRVTGEPIQYLVGYADFAGLRLRIEPGVFIPRPRTELLARLAVDRLVAGDAFLDIGCGAGPVAAYITRHAPGVVVTAVDRDDRSLAVARRNLPGCEVRCAASAADLTGSRFRVIAANLPYVPTGAIALMPYEARECEPRGSVDGGADGLDPLRCWADGLPGILAEQGIFLLEVARDQVPTATELLRTAAVGRGETVVHRDAELDATVIELITR
ncbi:methylase [Enemella evansiae]|uniref:N5-glutamine methyltransferase family protein n=1 Tax=Enemella evansiae TaxID=2016499 RepID=UPI000B979B82|nr:HemK/PrmC family methyltransferase [Enemella evansiae]OYN96383.1 methylase [Enemella evansiae]